MREAEPPPSQRDHGVVMSEIAYFPTYISPQPYLTLDSKRTPQGATVIEGFPAQAFANGVGVVTIVLVVGWLFYKGTFVFGRELMDVRADRDRWRTAAEASAEQVRKMLSEEQTSATVLRSIESYIRGQR